MKVRLALIFTLAICWSSLKAQNTDNIDTLDIIEWKENRLLTYSDFRGTRDSSVLVYGSPANGAASTKLTAQITWDENNKFTVSVTNSFIKSKSWMIIRNASVLNHEQGHFDISEIYARSLRKEIKILIDKGIENENTFQQLFNKHLDELEEYQNLYDSETLHGFDYSKQITWENNIKIEMAKLLEWMQ